MCIPAWSKAFGAARDLTSGRQSVPILEQYVKSEVETLSPTRVKLTVEVPFADLKPHLDKAYRTIGQQITVPGFRKGKVPSRIIDSRVGRGAVLQEAINDSLPDFYGQALMQADVRPLGSPQIEITDVPDPATGGDLMFSAEVDVRPQFELPGYDTLTVQLDPIEVTDADVDEQLDALRERFATLVGVDREARDGDFVTIDLTATIDDEDVDTATGLSYQIGSATMIAGLDDALPGLSAGEQTTFTSDLVGGERAGEPATIRVEVTQVKERLLPEVDDDFAQLASEFDTVDELRTDLRDSADRQKRFQAGIAARDKVLELLVAACEVPVPDTVVQAEVEEHLANEDRLDDDEHRVELTERVASALRTQLVLDKVAEAEDVSVSQAEFVEYLIQQAQLYGVAPNEFAEEVQKAGQVQPMLAEIARRKGLAIVLEQATITDAEGNLTSIDELLPRLARHDDDEDDDHDGHDHDHDDNDHGHDHDHDGHDHGHDHDHDHDHEHGDDGQSDQAGQPDPSTDRADGSA